MAYKTEKTAPKISVGADKEQPSQKCTVLPTSKTINYGRNIFILTIIIKESCVKCFQCLNNIQKNHFRRHISILE